MRELWEQLDGAAPAAILEQLPHVRSVGKASTEDLARDLLTRMDSTARTHYHPGP